MAACPFVSLSCSEHRLMRTLEGLLERCQADLHPRAAEVTSARDGMSELLQELEQAPCFVGDWTDHQ